VYLYKMLANDIARGPLLCCKTDADSSAVLEQAKQIGFDIHGVPDKSGLAYFMWYLKSLCTDHRQI